MSVVDSFHAYVYGTSFWYFLRGITRIIDPIRVISWFRPPSQQSFEANDLEIYTTRTDAYGLLTLSILVLVLAGAAPLPAALAPTRQQKSEVEAKRPYARAAILATIFHHVTTGIGAYGHWKLESHHTVAMDVGVYGCGALALLGVVALVSGLREEGKGKGA
ncbi:hypothetical protein K431DRAFT_113004 [Polychaeton citri CBS 116435]|uniref:Uncharacterized protein n=1 Tax=Polychaeton citri CBS 116435 TaxID=1314669 RepID=A0A9P4Q6S2_9PEZI|nr:hypothetical protein K431DRAFT_113004 [Polychaeton citri CBS 116435]